VALDRWAADSEQIWLELSEWTATVDPPADLLAFHTELGVSFAAISLERSELQSDPRNSTDGGSRLGRVAAGVGAHAVRTAPIRRVYRSSAGF